MTINMLLLLLIICLLISLSLSLKQPTTNNDMYKVKATKSITTISTLLSITLGLSSQSKVNAKTFFDTDVYGDKELKIATINKMKTKLRTAIIDDPKLAPMLLELALCDALGYNSQNEDGGPDGSIQYEVDREEFQALKPSISVIEKIKNDLKRTNTVSFADLVAYGGGEALESCGCPRTIVQIGRFDSKAANKKTFNFNVDPTGACYSAGLEPKDIAVMLLALGEVNRISKETIDYRNSKKDNKEEDDEEGDNWEGNVPSTFGRRDETFGAKLEINDFGSKFASIVLKGKNGASAGIFATAVLGDPQVKAAAQKYVSNDKAFKEDVIATYLKLTNLGESYNDLRRGG